VETVTTPVQEQRGYSLAQAASGLNKGRNSSAQGLSGVQIKALLSLYPVTEIQPSSVETLTTRRQGLHGYSLAQAASGLNKGRNSSAQGLPGMQSKALLSLYPVTGIPPSSADTLTTPVPELHGYSLAQAASGLNKGRNSSAQGLPGVQIKAVLPLYPVTGIRPSSADSLTTVAKELHGYLLALAASGLNKGRNSSAQGPTGVHIKAVLSLYPVAGIQPSSVETLTARV
jgi:hypothetical protein